MVGVNKPTANHNRVISDRIRHKFNPYLLA